MAARADELKKLERLCRYISHPAVSEQRLSLTPQGNVRYQLKTPYKDDTTHDIFEPLDFIARLAARIPKPRVHLTRFHGVFAPIRNLMLCPVFICMLLNLQVWPEWLLGREDKAEMLGNLSYPTYLLHGPLLLLCGAAIMAMGLQPSIAISFAVMVAFVLLVGGYGHM